MKKLAAAGASWAGRPWLLGLVAWTLFGLMRGANRVLAARLAGDLLDSRTTPLFDPLLGAWVWAALTPLAVRVCQRFPIRRSRWVPPVLAQLAAGFAFAVAHEVIFQPLMVLIKIGTLDPELHYVNTRNNLATNLLTVLGLYWGLAAILYSLESVRRSRDASLEAARLEAALSQARLDSLTVRMNPAHVLGALDELTVLIPKDPVAAEAAVVRLAGFLRAAVGNPE